MLVWYKAPSSDRVNNIKLKKKKKKEDHLSFVIQRESCRGGSWDKKLEMVWSPEKERGGKKPKTKKQATDEKIVTESLKRGFGPASELFMVPTMGSVLSGSVQVIVTRGRIRWHHRVIKQRQMLLWGLIAR